MQYTSNNPEQTREIIAELSSRLSGGDLLRLQGDLGSGKTTSAKYIAEYLGIKDEITSPTFVIIKSYHLPKVVQGISEMVHMDAYRLQGAPDAESVGLAEYLERKDVLILIEWPENVANILPANSKLLEFKYNGESQRTISANF